jgi:hypothetical protein
MAIFLNSLIPETAEAREAKQIHWSILAGSGSYMGETYLGVQFESESGNHTVDLSYGQTKGSISNNVHQINLKYTYSPFKFTFSEISTNALGIGLLATRWQSDSSFIDSPSQYPAENYYSPNRWRFGIVLEQNWTFRNFGIYFNWVLLDQAIIALYNNDKFIDGKSPWSAGFGLKWEI